MWNDIETTVDYLHFSVVADTVAELIEESNGNPISMRALKNSHFFEWEFFNTYILPFLF